MGDESSDEEVLKILCCRLSLRRKWVWLHTTVPSVLSCLLYITSLLADTVVACRLAWAHDLPRTGLSTVLLIYVPVIFTLLLRPLKATKVLTCSSIVGRILCAIVEAAALPLIIAVRLLSRVLWTVTVVNKKTQDEVIREYPTLLPREVHSFLFLQVFLHCCPQAVLQTHLLLLQITTDKYTEYWQVVSLLTSVISVAACVASFHRYEAQVLAGRPALLLLTPPDTPESYLSLLPIQTSEVIGLEVDSLPGKVVSFFSWFFLIHSRILCIVITYEIYPLTTSIIVFSHIVLFLLYLILSQGTTYHNTPAKLLNATISIVALVEVSVRFRKVTLLYVLFFISVVAEDTILTILFFIYSSDVCSSGALSCDHFGVYTYVVINSHVIGAILFSIYLTQCLPVGTSVSVSMSASSSTVSVMQ